MARATSAGCASARRSARRSSRPASSNSQIASMTRAVSSISAPERLEEARHDRLPERVPRGLADPGLRSEEHTSELQSLTKLVCRLLLEKKKHVRDAGDGSD